MRAHKEIYSIFIMRYGFLRSNISSWFQNGPNSIRIKMIDNTELVYTFEDHSNWILETREMFTKRLIKELKNKKGD